MSYAPKHASSFYKHQGSVTSWTRTAAIRTGSFVFIDDETDDRSNKRIFEVFMYISQF